MRRAWVLLALLASLPACRSRTYQARVRYDEGVAALAEKKWDDASKALLDARDKAGADGLLRFRAAYDLGVTYAQQAESLAQEPEKAIPPLGQAIAWFRAALAEAPKDADAHHNLEVALRRLALLEDKAHAGKNKLEGRLAALIDAARGVRDGVRGVLEKERSQGAGADPLAFQGDLDGLASQARTLLADAGTVSDLAGDEASRIESTKAEERTPEQQMRAAQLAALDRYVQRARTDLADLARSLRRLDATDGHRRAEASLAELKRAAEQLGDPVTILRAIAADEVELGGETQALAAARSAGRKLDAAPAAQAPAWLDAPHLGELQARAKDRLSEVVTRLRAAVDAPAPKTPPADAQGSEQKKAQEAQRAKVLAMAREALPHLDQAAAGMDQAGQALAGDRPGDAVPGEERAVEELSAALERFAELRGLIDLAWAEQGQVVALLTPPARRAANAAPEPEREPAAAMSGPERARAVGGATARNRERMGRVGGLIAEQKAELAQQAAKLAFPTSQADTGPQAEQAKRELAAKRQLFDRAEALRAKAGGALAQVAARLGKGQPLPPAKEALTDLEELRRLFFSVIELLQELTHDQGETRDRTATAQAQPAGPRAAALPALGKRQADHVTMGEAVARALAAQADAAGNASDPKAADAAKRMREAAGEVQAGNGDMTTARDALGKKPADLTPTLDAQQSALRHLEDALRLLQPPQQDQKDQDQKKQQQQQKQQQAKQGDQKQDQARQGEQRAAQAVRDREAQQRRRERERQRIQNEPVEKDW
jgi:hypothetical protein